jgi:hypothetical protein
MELYTTSNLKLSKVSESLSEEELEDTLITSQYFPNQITKTI